MIRSTISCIIRTDILNGGDLMDLKFPDQESWENWLSRNDQSDEGVYLIFDKSKESSSLTSEQALDVALRYGWIDGIIKKIDDQFYKKYFKKRAEKSIWSTKNKNRVVELTRAGRMMPSGLKIVEISKSNGCWDKGDSMPDDYDLDAFKSLVRQHDHHAYEQFDRFSPSVQKTYALSYYALKKPESREKRIHVIIDRSIRHLKPME
jgi:uncharacterized protein YdeI (YjbR/CyaY-like superfamily)